MTTASHLNASISTLMFQFSDVDTKKSERESRLQVAILTISEAFQRSRAQLYWHLACSAACCTSSLLSGPRWLELSCGRL